MPYAFHNEPPVVILVLNFLSTPISICAIDIKLLLGAYTVTLTGIPDFWSLTSPVITIVSPDEYEFLSVVIVNLPKDVCKDDNVYDEVDDESDCEASFNEMLILPIKCPASLKAEIL